MPNEKNKHKTALPGGKVEKKKPTKEVDEKYLVIYRAASMAYPETESSYAFEICQELQKNPENFEKAHERLRRLFFNLDEGNIQEKQCINYIKKILKEDYGFEPLGHKRSSFSDELKSFSRNRRRSIY